MEHIKFIASAIASIIAVVAYVPYVFDTMRGKCQPHLYTWISWFLITMTVGIILLRGGAGIGAIPTLIGAAVNSVFVYLAMLHGTKDIVELDKICLALAIVGLGLYVGVQEHPLVALGIILLADLLSFVPTFRKTHNAPFSESLPTYYLTIVKAVLVLVALKTYTALTMAYYVVWILVISYFLLSVAVWRKQHNLDVA